jgi:cyclophilin family peptidyl-prolyl cis-trans isomerase/protein-disulfide isomerase
MKKLILPVVLMLTILLSACNAAGKTAEPTAAPTAAPSTAPTEAAASGSDQTQAVDPITSEENPCVPFNLLSQSLITPYPGLPGVTDEDYIVGPKDAPVTFMVYSEPQCPYCAQFDPLVESFTALYPNDVRFVFRLRPFPESFHDKSILASQAMVAAGLQGKFDEFRIWLFQHQSKNPNDPEVANLADTEFWAGLAPADLDDWLKERVAVLGINPDQLLKDMVSDAVVKKVQDAKTKADAIGVTGTPTLFINGYPWPENQRSNEIFSIYTELLLNQEREYGACPAMEIDQSKTYSATISTTKGDIAVELYADKAPNAVNSFVYLAREGWYNNLPIVSTDQFMLSGDPTDTGYGGPGYAYMDEIDNSLNFNEAGMLATFAYNIGSGTNGSSFFINKIALPDQEGRTIFGKVTSGLDVLNKLEIRDNIFNPALDEVLGITITEK